MKKRISALLFSAAVATFGIAGAFAHPTGDDGKGGHKESEEGRPVTITGELIDTACFMTSDGDAKGKDHAACATKCMATGIPAGIMPEGAKDADEALFLLTNPQVLAPYAAQTIKVEGVEYEHRHSIDVKKLYVKNGENWKEVALKDEHHGMGGMSDGDKKDDGMKGMDMGGMKMPATQPAAH
jgi:hypothetical protein